MQSRWIVLWSCLGSLLIASTSARADDQQACLDASSAAQDLRQAAKLVAAREQLLVCAQERCPAVVRRDCAGWLADVEVALPTLAITAKDDHGADIITARVILDGKPYLDHLDGKALPIDPGVHTVRLEVEGIPPSEQQIVVREGEKNRPLALVVTRPTAGPPIDEHAPPPPPRPVEPARVVHDEPAHAIDAPAAPPEDSTRLRRQIGLVAAGVGLVGLGAGVVFGLRASSQWSDAKAACGAGCLPDSHAYSLRDDATRSATISTVGFIAGGAALAAGAVLYLTARETQPHPAVTAVVRALASGCVGYAGAF